MAYWCLAVRDSASQPFVFTFGDKDRDCVQFERDDMRSDHKATNLRVYRADSARMSHVTAATEKLNRLVLA